MSYGNYGGGGGLGGGGFMGGGGSQGGSNDSPGMGKARGQQTTRPVTTHQIVSAEQSHPDADFVIDGAEAGQLTFVGVVRSVQKAATNVSFSIDDGYGVVDVRQWLESVEDEGGQTSGIENPDRFGFGYSQDVYVRVIGTIKSFHDKRHISALSIRPITNFNEIAFHFLHVAQVNLLITRGPVPTAGGAAPQQDSYMQSNNPYQQQAHGGGGYGGGGGGGGAGGGGQDPYAEITNPVQKKVMTYIAGLGNNIPGEGVMIQQISRAIGGGNLDVLRRQIADLVSDGHLYTTTDDDHVLPTA